MKIKLVIAAIITTLSISVNAEVFKCVDTEGKTVYQNTPYPNDKGIFINLDKNTKMSVEEYKKNKEQDEEHIKQELKELPKKQDRKIISKALEQVSQKFSKEEARKILKAEGIDYTESSFIKN